ncbi:MAG: hypothetical protein ACK4P5_09265 [Fimbriimonadales bacterium]
MRRHSWRRSVGVGVPADERCLDRNAQATGQARLDKNVQATGVISPAPHFLNDFSES